MIRKKIDIDNIENEYDNLFYRFFKFVAKNQSYFILILIIVGIFLVLILNGFYFKDKEKGFEIKIESGLKEFQKR